MEKFTDGWVQHLRNTARHATTPRNYRCPLCDTEFKPNLDAFKAHVRSDSSKHPNLTENSDIEVAFSNIVTHEVDANKAEGSAAKPRRVSESSRSAAKRRDVSGNAEADDAGEDELDRLNLVGDEAEGSRQGGERWCPPPSPNTRQRNSSPPPTPRRRKTQQSEDINDFRRSSQQRNPTAHQLWVPPDDGRRTVARRARASQTMRGRLASSSNRRRSPARDPAQVQNTHVRGQSTPNNDSKWNMTRQPCIRQVQPAQLTAEVRTVMCRIALQEQRIFKELAERRGAAASQHQYMTMIGLHQTLLHLHHDFFLSSQHPSAPDMVRRAATQFNMPARMWHIGIHAFLDFLRNRLPESLEYILGFLYVAWTMMALVVETVPAFKDTWIECLGDLGRYRMAIEDNDRASKEIWSNVSRYWYTQAAERCPTTGRLYHHLAILARPNVLEQLFLYAKSICVEHPFESTKNSVMTLFNPLISPEFELNEDMVPAYINFVRVHAILFSGRAMEQLEASLNVFVELLDDQITEDCQGKKCRHRGCSSTHCQDCDWLQSGYQMGISLSCLLLCYGNKSSPLMRGILGHDGVDGGENEPPRSAEFDVVLEKLRSRFDTAVSLTEKTYTIVARRWGDVNTLPFLNTMLAFYLCMSRHPNAMKHLEDKFPWKLTAVLLNHILRNCHRTLDIDRTDFQRYEREPLPRPLPEDYAMRGFAYTKSYFPEDWFSNDEITSEEKVVERPTLVGRRMERILWIGRMLARCEKWLLWDAATETFGVTAKYEMDIVDEPRPPRPPVSPQPPRVITLTAEVLDAMSSDSMSEDASEDESEDDMSAD